MKTAELTGATLDYWTAKAQGCKLVVFDDSGRCIVQIGKGGFDFRISPRGGMLFSPSTDWAQGGPILEREGIALGRAYEDPKVWIADATGTDELTLDLGLSQHAVGPTSLIAAMRAYVASKFGDTVPDEAAP